MFLKVYFKVRISNPQIVILQSTLQDHLKQFFVKISDQNFPFVRTFVFRETIRFLFTLQAWKFVYILLQKVFNCKQFSCIWITFWPKSLGNLTPNSQWRSLQCSPIPSSCWRNSQNFLKKIIQTLCLLNCDDGNWISWKNNSEMC